jgi:hypothetical protein
MTQIIDVNTLPYTPEQLAYFQQEMEKYRLPWITKAWKKVGVPFIRYSILPAILLIAVLGMIYMGSRYGSNAWMWTFDKTLAFFYIFGFGGFTLLSFICEKVTTNQLRKRLGLPKKDFAMLIIAFQITGM